MNTFCEIRMLLEEYGPEALETNSAPLDLHVEAHNLKHPLDRKCHAGRKREELFCFAGEGGVQSVRGGGLLF